MLNKSYALYETKKDYNVIKGEVPDFGYDVKLAIMVDGTKKTDMPTSPLASNGSYYKVDVSCTSSKTKGLWDYNAWRLNLDYIESNSKCTLTFTSSMSKADYDKYIQAGVALRRNTYRGKDITSLWKNGDLYKQIADGTFADVYVGDYILSSKTATVDGKSQPIIWLIADLDNYFSMGRGQENMLTTHHATIIPAGLLGNAQMNTSDTTAGGYKGSKMYSTTLPKMLTDYITPDFGAHVIEYQTFVTNAVTDGVATGYEWPKRKLDLMSEINVYGTTVWGSSGLDVTLDCLQYAIFNLKPELIHQDLNGNSLWYWLKAVEDTQKFASVDGLGAGHQSATSNAGVRPRFLID